MKKVWSYVLAAMLVMVLASSCKKDALYIQMPDRVWEYAVASQFARIVFCGEDKASVLQADVSTGYAQASHGPYTTDGHSVDIAGETSTHLVRTFSHLKHSSANKNLTELQPQSWSTLKKSVWTTVVDGDGYLAFFDKYGKCVQGFYRNIVRKEGYPFGWEWSKLDYSLSGSTLSCKGVTGVLYKDVIRLPKYGALCSAFPVEEDATSSLEGTLWTLKSDGYPGVLIFNSAQHFTRILLMSAIVWEVKNGTYSVEADGLHLQMAEFKETCPISEGRFTFLNKTYVLVED